MSSGGAGKVGVTYLLKGSTGNHERHERHEIHEKTKEMTPDGSPFLFERVHGLRWRMPLVFVCFVSFVVDFFAI